MSESTSQESGSRQRPDSSTDRVLGLLDLFTLERPLWTVDMLVDHLRLGRATVYRYVRALADTGFLASAGGAGYALGPRFVEIDRQIRLSDPLLQIAPRVMEAHGAEVAGAQLLCRFYRSQVLCIHQERTDERIEMSMERGRPFSMYRGAPSRVILAHLPAYQLQRHYLFSPDEISAAGMGNSWLEFRDQMKAVRKAGFLVASDIEPFLVGISAPIFNAPDSVDASLCLVRLRKETSEADIERLSELVRLMASQISAELQQPEEKPAPAKKASKPRATRKRASPTDA